MIGIQFWAASYCRSMLGFYEGIGMAYNVPIRVCVIESKNLNRSALGWEEDEFSHLDMVSIGDNPQRAHQKLENFKDWHQVFGAYQANRLFQDLILSSRDIGVPLGVCSEAPLNMVVPGLKRRLKDFYLVKRLPHKMKPYIAASDFVINLSGDDCRSFVKLGWTNEQIIPCGYFPPPLSGSKFRIREQNPKKAFHILCTGGMTWHRGQEVLINALILLKKWGMNCRVTMTQSGPFEASFKKAAAEFDLPIDFVGMVPMSQLIELLERCDCYVATGREEPWGIRVNDALHCGAPLVVSRGMGACKIVDEFGCGMTFNKEDYIDLAWKLRALISDQTVYTKLSTRVSEASEQSKPHVIAAKIVDTLQADFPNWSGNTK